MQNENKRTAPDFYNFSQNGRYTVPVNTRLVLSLPVTVFRPEAMRVTERIADNGKWFEVETYNERSQNWVMQKSHASEEVAVLDANNWYPEPTQPEEPAACSDDDSPSP